VYGFNFNNLIALLRHILFVDNVFLTAVLLILLFVVDREALTISFSYWSFLSLSHSSSLNSSAVGSAAVQEWSTIQESCGRLLQTQDRGAQ
tara:strand:- start:870 stop:1142 length:273 start_codon:yes stop_codon:yes gene_type:complete